MDILIAGTYTRRDAPAVTKDQELGRGIYIFPYDKETGTAGELLAEIKAENPSWVCMKDSRLFAVSEKEECAELLEYEMKNGTDGLHIKQTADLKMKGSSSCHMEIDEKRDRLYLSDYGSGDFKVIDISVTGAPELLREFYFTGKGPRRDRQEASHIHSCCVSGDELYTADLGNDAVYLFDLRSELPEQIREIRAQSGAGPRHMRVLEKEGQKYLYVVNELNCTIAVYREGRRIQILPLSGWQGARGELAADICISEDQYLYASVRETGEIRVFAIEGNGKLKEIQNADIRSVLPEDGQKRSEDSGGIRSICLDQGQKHFIAADQQAGMIVIFDRRADGMLVQGRVLKQVPVPVKVMTAGLLHTIC